MDTKHKIFFVGIGGISMSGLALYLSKNGYDVSGSDISENEQVKMLKNHGIKVFLGHNKTNVEGSELVVFNSAIDEHNPELTRAKNLGLKIISRSELLRLVSREHEHVVAVAGTHGKTTTSAMIGEIFCLAGLAPTIHIGGVSKNLGTNFLIGEKQYFITEACEYKDNFLSLNPEVGVVLNVDDDHLDYFKTKQNLKRSFERFAFQSDFSIVYDGFLQKNSKKTEKIVQIGENSQYCWADNIEIEANKKYGFDAIFCGEYVGRIHLGVFHKHNVTDALFAVAVAKYYGISNQIIVRALENFAGVRRRFEEIGWSGGVRVVIDYAHHPKEISSTMTSAKDITKGRLFVVFQPHTYSRTKKLFNEFVSCFDLADKLYIFRTYPARENYDKKYNARTLSKEISKHKKCLYFSSFKKMKASIQKDIKEGDMLLVLGAGDIDHFANYFLE
ncbi:MAG: UDP-N-acetylmuramate--L-alanine ligase [Christensenellales bacterium]